MEARTLTGGWIEAVQRDVDDVCALYAPDATFHPTLSDQFVTEANGVRKYFDAFVPKRPVVRITRSVQCDVAEHAVLHSGTYEIELGDPNSRELVRARFTFLWQRFNGTWRITHHHSSASP